MDYKIIFAHGYTASPQADWYPNISRELKKRKIDFAVPFLPGGLHPKSKVWIEKIHQEVKKTKKPIILVGHSLGSRAVLLYLDKYPRRIMMVLLIAAFSNDTQNAQRHDGTTYPDFFEYKINLEKIKSLVGKFIIMHSKDDSALDYSQGVEVAKDLGAELITYKDRDHFSEPENYKYVLEVLLREIETRKQKK